MTEKAAGTQTASMMNIYINGRPCMLSEKLDKPKCTITVAVDSSDVSIVLRPGDSKAIEQINIENLGEPGPGMSIEVKLLTASGKEYPTPIVLQEFSGGKLNIWMRYTS